MGAGKTTAIGTLSDIAVVSTEAANTERHLADKPTTTVALDYGEISISDEEKLRLYGIPGQRRFDFMWRILADRARGLVLLINNDVPDPLGLLLEFLAEFDDLCQRGAVVVGVTRSDLGDGPEIADYARALNSARPGIVVPIFTIDPRESDQLRIALLVLVANIEMRSALGAREVLPA